VLFIRVIRGLSLLLPRESGSFSLQFFNLFSRSAAPGKPAF